MKPHIVPYFFPVINAICFYKQCYIAVIFGCTVKFIRNAGARKFIEHFYRYDLKPVFRPSQKGELVDNAKMCGRK